MTEKQKIVAVLGVVLIAVLFIVLYRSIVSWSHFAKPIESSISKELPKKAVPTTPDTIVDKIVENDADASVLSEEENGEVDAVKESIQDIDTVTNIYNEQ